MSEQLTNFNPEIDIDKNLKPEELSYILQIQDSFYFKDEIKTLEYFSDFDELKTIRASIAILFPDIKLHSDQHLYENLKQEGQAYLSTDEIGEYISTAIQRKIIFPHKYKELYDEMEEQHVYEELLTELAYARHENDIYGTYVVAQDLKLLYPDRFENLEQISLFATNCWQERIMREIQYMKNNTELLQYYDYATELASAINVVNFPAKIIFNEQEWTELLDYVELLKSEGEYSSVVEFLAKLKIIAAKEVKISENGLNLIF